MYNFTIEKILTKIFWLYTLLHKIDKGKRTGRIPFSCGFTEWSNDMETSIGQVIKRLRQERKITLQQLSAQVGLSPSFLSQLERGNTTIAIDSLVKVAEALGTDIYAILNASQTSAPTQDQYILRSYQRHDAVLQSEHEIQTNLSAVSLGKAMMAVRSHCCRTSRTSLFPSPGIRERNFSTSWKVR